MSKDKMPPQFRTGEEVFNGWLQDLKSGEGPVFYAHSLPAPELAPERVIVIAGAPGVGKTALVMNVVVEALRANESLRALICNAEMSTRSLLDRQLSRLSGIDGETLRQRQITPELEGHYADGIATLRPLMERVAFLEAPFGMARVAQAADEHRADIIVLDYIQRFQPNAAGGDTRTNLNAIMAEVRKFAAAGCTVLAVSAISRSKNNGGQTSYDGAGLASLRESSELEYGADDVFMLDGNPESRRMRLKHLKCRHGARRSIELQFTPAIQAFELPERLAEDAQAATLKPKSRAGKSGKKGAGSSEGLTKLCNQTPAAATSGEKEGSQC